MPTPPSRYLPVTLGARKPIQRTPKLSSSISARGAPSHHLKLISASTRRKSGLAFGSAGAGVLPGARYTWPLKDAVLKYSPCSPLRRSAPSVVKRAEAGTVSMAGNSAASSAPCCLLYTSDAADEEDR